MICAHSLRHRNIVKNGRPRNLFSRENPGIGTSQAGKIYESLLKNQTGRPYSAPYGGPHRVLLPFLAEDPVLLYHRRKYFTSPKGVQFPRSPNRRLVQNNRAPGRMQQESGNCFAVILLSGSYLIETVGHMISDKFP